MEFSTPRQIACLISLFMVYNYVFREHVGNISKCPTGQLEYVINELDKSVPVKLGENLKNLTRKMDRIQNNTDLTKLVYRSKDYEYGSYPLMLSKFYVPRQLLSFGILFCL